MGQSKQVNPILVHLFICTAGCAEKTNEGGDGVTTHSEDRNHFLTGFSIPLRILQNLFQHWRRYCQSTKMRRNTKTTGSEDDEVRLRQVSGRIIGEYGGSLELSGHFSSEIKR
uniref:Uncharacterized protein n=1 Tax=Opuntia streptacantha TaxID=393608 RepID=A0A7C8YYJ0_OPUST